VRRLLVAEDGFTLIETMVAVAMMGIVVVAMFAILYVGQSGSKTIVDWGDQNQQLRVAMRQMAEDLTNSWLVSVEPNAAGVQVYGEQTFAAKDVSYSNFGWTAGQEEWPGDLADWPAVIVRYSLQGNSLIREASDAFGMVSSQVIVSNLEAGSSIESNGPNQVKVVLRRAAGGGKRVGEVQSVFFVR